MKNEKENKNTENQDHKVNQSQPEVNDVIQNKDEGQTEKFQNTNPRDTRI